MKHSNLAHWIGLAGIALATITPRAHGQAYESYYMHQNNYPVGETQWSDDVQGLAHDDNNWFITNTHFIRKIPVQHDLRTVNLLSPGVIYKGVADYPELQGYNHYGDPDVFRFGGIDYLVVPIEEGEATCSTGLRGGIAILRCTDLSYVAHTTFPDQCNDAGWVAINEQGVLVSSHQHVGQLNTFPPCTSPGLRFYVINWVLLHATGHLSLTFSHEVHPTDEQGQCLEMVTMQGGEFAPGDGLLYLISGFYNDSNGLEEREGIHVLETATYRRVQHSTRGFGHFDYYYNPGHPTDEEPEGLTIWDLDDGRAPGIRGQLHALVSDNDDPGIPGGESGDVDFKHYTQVIHADRSSSNTCQTGTAGCPFHTIGGAITLGWDGAEVRIRTGAYIETPTISKKLRVTAEGGTVRIGG